MHTGPETAGRIARIRGRYQAGVPRISVERARHFTASWRETASGDLSPAVRVAMAVRNVYANMTLYLDPDDRIAGTWCEHFLGTPLDVERGLFNQVISTETRRASLLRFRVGRLSRFLLYALRRIGPRELIRGARKPGPGPLPVDLSLTTLSRRRVNPFDLDAKDAAEFRKDLLPFWKGRTAAERVEQALDRAKLFSDEVREFMRAMALTPSRQVMVLSPSAAVCTYQGHWIPDFRRVLEEGLLGMRERVRREREAAAAAPEEEKDFLRSLEIALDGVITFADRLAGRVRQEVEAQSDPKRRRELEALLEACAWAPLRPARSFRQALQALWTVKCALDIAHPTNVQAPGRLDQLLGPYYDKDAAEGRVTREEARELCEEFLLKVMSHNIRPESNILGRFYLRFEGSEPVTLGGLTPEGEDATHEMTYILLEAAERSRAVTNVVLRVHEKTPDRLHLAAADAFYRGASNLSVMNDAVHVPALMHRGVSQEDARGYAVTGCTDVICPGRTGGLSISGLLLCRVLDATLRNGDLMTLAGPVRNVGPRTGDAGTFESFEQLVDAFVTQAGHAVDRIVEASNLRDRVFAEHLPAPFVSAFVDGCLQNRADVTRGGAVYDVSLVNLINSLANVVDSLYVIQRLVFEERRVTLKELMAAVDADFEGAPELHRRILSLEGKWGNGNPESDRLARTITSRLFEQVERHRGFRGGPWSSVINSMTSHTIDGRLSVATPDGRRAATPYASSCNPYNVERAGVTGVLRSVAAVDFQHVLGCSVNLRVHPSAIGRTPEARMKWVHLLRTYFALGGPQLQPTVASAEVLRSAQSDPAAYGGLLVKVGGYSAYFTELGREIQDEVISRTEHGQAA